MSVIAFDGVCLGDGPVTGVGRAFLDGLRAYAATSERECVLLVPTGARAPELPQVRAVDAPRGRWRRQRLLPPLLRRLGAALLHSSVASVPLAAPCPTVATAHDLPWLHPEAGERTSFWRCAARVMAPSTMTQRDVQRLVTAPARKVELVPHGVEPPAQPPLPETERSGPLLVLGDDPAPTCTATTVAGGVELSWDDVAGVSTWQVRRNGSWLATTNQTTFLDDGAAAGDTWQIRYRAGGVRHDIDCG